jgi:hypothetical protein
MRHQAIRPNGWRTEKRSILNHSAAGTSSFLRLFYACRRIVRISAAFLRAFSEMQIKGGISYDASNIIFHNYRAKTKAYSRGSRS